MFEASSTFLLPNGLHDLLPPEAAHEAKAIGTLMKVFAASGYERVKPPMVEFETSLLDGSGAAMDKHTFRLMDPVSQRMMGVRADITPQIARIARSRLVQVPRPLRLCYAGQVLRVKGSQLRPGRQFAQVGAELIGALEPEADAEVVLLAAHAAEVVGIRQPTIDLCVPTMVRRICESAGLNEEAARALRDAVDRKDAASVREVGGGAAVSLERLMRASGPAERALQLLDGIVLPEPAEKDRHRLREAMRLIRKAKPDLTVTIDFVEHRGFEYQDGLSFTMFARGVAGELGSGGRYKASGHEPATGFTLYMDMVLQAMPAPASAARLYLPHGTAWAVGEGLRREGWVTVNGLSPVAEAVVEARRLDCTHLFENGAPRAVD